MVIGVCLTSTSGMEMGAVRAAFKKLFPSNSVLVQGYNCFSETNKQLSGIQETLTSASDRLHQLMKILDKKPIKVENYFVSIENGVDTQGYDFGMVLVTGPDEEVHLALTKKVKFPEEISRKDLEEAVLEVIRENYC